MPYEGERAGLPGLNAVFGLDEFRALLAPRAAEAPRAGGFAPYPAGRPRRHVWAVDGSNIHHEFEWGGLEVGAGLVSLGAVRLDTGRLASLERLPESGAVSPEALRSCETGESHGFVLPGANAFRSDGASPLEWAREVVSQRLSRTVPFPGLGGESLAETLFVLIEGVVPGCPFPDCREGDLRVSRPDAPVRCPSCSGWVHLSDSLAAHRHLSEDAPSPEFLATVRDALETLCLLSLLRACVRSPEGLDLLADSAFLMDGLLALRDGLGWFAPAVRREIASVQAALAGSRPGAELLVASGVKGGRTARVLAAAGRREDWEAPPGSFLLLEAPSPRHYGRPLYLRSLRGWGLTLNVFNAGPGGPSSGVPGDLCHTVEEVITGTGDLLPLRRAHYHASIPLRAGRQLLESLVRG